MQLLSTLHHRSHAAACGGEPPHAPIPVCDTCDVMAGKKPPKRSASRRRLPGSSASCRCVGYCVCYVRLTLLVHRCRAASQCWRPTLLWVWCVWCICLLQEAEESKQLDDLKNTKKDKKLKKKITGAGAGRRPVGAGHSVAGSSASGGGSVGGDLFSLDELQDLSGTNQARLPPHVASLTAVSLFACAAVDIDGAINVLGAAGVEGKKQELDRHPEKRRKSVRLVWWQTSCWVRTDVSCYRRMRSISSARQPS